MRPFIGARVVAVALPVLVLSGIVHARNPQTAPPKIVPQNSGTQQRLVAVSAVNTNIAWASGANGTFTRTINGGDTWTAGQVAGAEKLDFRDVHGVDANVAYLLAAGKGNASRIYKTMDGGAHWTTQFTNADPEGFYDCFDFWTADRGVATGDAINGELAILTTIDGGVHWTRVSPSTLPPALPGEGSFASSGTCITTQPGGRAWISTTKSRVLRSTDFGKTWKVSLTPIPSFPDSGGVTSVSFRDEKNGLAFGGYGARPGDTTIAVSVDGGASWAPLSRPPIESGMFGGSYVQSALTISWVVVGPKGAAYSRDNGQTWATIDTENYWGLSFVKGNRGWIVGRGGRIVRLGDF